VVLELLAISVVVLQIVHGITLEFVRATEICIFAFTMSSNVGQKAC